MTTTTQPQKSLARRFLHILLGLTVSGILAGAAIVLALLVQMHPLASYHDVKQNHRPSDAVLLDRNGEALHQLRVNFDVRQGQWISLEDVSPALLHALIVTEDKRFYQHPGVDIAAIAGAAWSNLTHTHTRGASTITMQLVGILDPSLAPSGSRSLWQKMQQAVSAIALERYWHKEQILEAYLNVVAFRGELVGIAAMSEGLFGKHPNGLNAREAAVAVALIRSPNVPEATVVRRACTVLHTMQATNAQQECQALADFVHVRFAQPRQSPSQGIAPHIARHILNNPQIIRHHPTLLVPSTLDIQVQRVALNSLRQHLTELAGKNVEDGAVIVLDNATGEVLAWVGSSGEALSQAAEIDSVLAMRQPGSTLKPFLYGLAIEQRRLTAASLLDDSPLNLNVGGGLYIPQNYDRSFKGWVSVRTALASSLNIPAVRTLVMIGPDIFARTLVNLGLPLQENGDYYGYSLALGSAEVSLLTLTNAFRALPNGGQASHVRWLPSTVDTAAETTNHTTSGQSLLSLTPFTYALNPDALHTNTSGISPQAAWIIGSILSDREARVTTFGLDSELNTRYWSAVKTGTSKDMRDNWAIGYSTRYTVGVWVGNASGAAMWGVSGTSGAAPVWRDVMNYLYQRDVEHGQLSAWSAPQAPQGIVQSHIHYEPAIEPERVEWFIESTERTTIIMSVSSLSQGQNDDPAAPARILSPVSGTIVAIDPDIPPENQRLWLRSNRNDVRWQIGEHIIGTGSQVAWLPVPGRHQIALVNMDSGEALDHITLEIRANIPRNADHRPSAHSGASR